VAQVPVYMTEGMATRAAALLTTLSEWGSQGFSNINVPKHHTTSLPKRFEMWRPEYAKLPGPCVLFATPGMLQGGVSLQVLKQWAPEAKNMVLLPGTCTAGTVGGMLLHTKKGRDGKVVKIDGNTELHVRCKVRAPFPCMLHAVYMSTHLLCSTLGTRLWGTLLHC
jgi:integrator complex subunit 11